MSDNAKEALGWFLIGFFLLASIAVVVGGIAYLNHDANMNRKHFRDSCYASGGSIVNEEVSKDTFVKTCKGPS